jgi:hypothetical protein
MCVKRVGCEQSGHRKEETQMGNKGGIVRDPQVSGVSMTGIKI